MPHTITSTALLAATATDKKALNDIYELLTRLYVRNRNQHRRSHWFKSLSTFRKELGKLLVEMDTPKPAAALETRLQFWDAACVHQWYLTFTQLVAAGQFAVLGLVLMAATARVCKVVGITDFYEEVGSQDMKSVLQSIERGDAVALFGDLGAEQVDEGVVIQRD